MARSRRKLAWFAGATVVVVAGAAFAGWWYWIRDDAPSEADIDTAGETLDEAAGSGDDTGSADGQSAGEVEGTWAIDQSIGSFDDFSGTWAGYRFDEEVASIGANTAVGRTPEVTGTMTVAGDEVTAVDVEVDLTTLQSDQRERDNALRTRGLESDEFPTATFALTEPIPLPAGAADGERISVSATGELTIHGVTNEATIQLEAQLRDNAAAIVGSAPVALADYNIEPPTGFSVLSVAERGTFEVQLFFAQR